MFLQVKMGRSPSPRRRDDRRRDRERDRDRDRDRERRRPRTRSRSRSLDRRRRSPERRRSPSPRRRRSRTASPGPSTSFVKPKKTFGERPIVTPADLEGKSPEEQEMLKVMGFCGFDTTKGKKVDDNVEGDVHVVLKRKYRQYMNRKGGFNRPLDFVAWFLGQHSVPAFLQCWSVLVVRLICDIFLAWFYMNVIYYVDLFITCPFIIRQVNGHW